MENRMNTLAGTDVFKLKPGDMDHLFRRAGLTGNDLAPFVYNAEQAAVSSPSEWFKTLAESPSFKQIAKKTLQPDLKIDFRHGGAGAAEDKYCALLSADDQTVLLQLFNSESDIILALFPDWGKFLDWWTNAYASHGVEGYKTVFPGTMDTEVLVCAMHSVDIYRRAYMESMLDYSGGLNMSLKIQDFVQFLERSLASRDKRWLLPTLFEITPGLKTGSISVQPEHIKQLEDLGFVSRDADVLTLSERSMIMGTEFISSWMGSAGLQATALLKGKERNLSRVYLAPTAFSNHLFSFETSGGAGSRFRHQAATRTGLINTLSSWMEALQKVTGIMPAKPAHAAAEQSQTFCGQCGSEIRPGKKFCTNCGASA